MTIRTYDSSGATLSTSTTDGTTASKLVDSGADFVTDNIQIGDLVTNDTDVTTTYVSAVDDLNTLSLEDDIFISGEDYTITRAYSSLSTWETATSAALSEVQILDCFDSQDHNDSVTVDGASGLSATIYRLIRSSANCATPFVGTKTSGAGFVKAGSNANVFVLKEDFARIHKIRAKNTSTYSGPANRSCFGVTAADNCKITHCLVYDSTARAYRFAFVAYGLTSSIPDNTLFYNCICTGSSIVGFSSGWVDPFANNSTSTNTYFINCTHNTSGDGFTAWSGSTDYCYNNLAVGSGTCYSGSFTGKDKNVSVDATAPGTNSQQSSGATVDSNGFLQLSVGVGQNPYDDISGSNDFNDFFRNDTSGDTLFSLDIRGATRPKEDTADSAWDVGVNQALITEIPRTTFFF